MDETILAMKNIFLSSLLAIFSSTLLSAQDLEVDSVETDNGSVAITFIGHGSLMMQYNDITIHIDPFGKEADYSKLPGADLVLITHHHGDHCDPKALEKIMNDNTTLYLTELAKEQVDKGNVMKINQTKIYNDIKIESLPAYNLVHKRDNGEFFHPKGCCNSYVLTIDGLRIFIGGDTENTPEMKALQDIDIAFLPMNLPYTMTPEMVADAAKAFKPKVLYPYHYGDTDVNKLLELMENTGEVEVKVRQMQ